MGEDKRKDPTLLIFSVWQSASPCTFLKDIFPSSTCFRDKRGYLMLILTNYFSFEKKISVDTAEGQSLLGPALAGFQLDSGGPFPFPVKPSRGL